MHDTRLAQFKMFELNGEAQKNVVIGGKAYVGGRGVDKAGNCTMDIIVFDNKSGQYCCSYCEVSDRIAGQLLNEYNGF